MKKNMFLRVASVLLVLTLLSTCAISGTFAKYVTTGSSEDSARVAQWGIQITATNADALFATEYGATVKSDVDVVAPGTNGTFGGFTVTGDPEVSCKVTYTATVALTGSWEDADGDFYFPLTLTVGGTPVDLSAAQDAIDNSDAADKIEAAIQAAIAAQTATYGPEDTVAAALSFDWAWAFGANDNAISGNDAKDTHLGNIAAGLVDGKTAPNISIDVTATISQVD